MGLDILVLKPIKKTKELVKNEEYEILEKDSPLLMFKEFLFKKSIKYCDFDKTFAKAGLLSDDFNDYKWCMSGCIDKSIKTDDLLSLINYRKEDVNYTIIIGIEKDGVYENQISNPYYEFENQNTKDRIVIINPLIITKKEMCLCYEEVGYQRKGANKQFYEDDMWSSKEVVDMKTLKEHWKKYFSGEGNVRKEGTSELIDNTLILEKNVPYGYGLEFDNSAKQNRRDFKENIIDNFIEGETYVSYC